MSRLSLIISAPSGAGKTTIISKLLESDDRLGFSISTTTRPRREGEIDGASYNFASREEFQRMIRENTFIEWALVHDNYYGTTKKEIDRIQQTGKIPILDVDVQGARLLKDRLEGAAYLFIVPPSREVLESRLRNRKTDSESQIEIRLRKALWELTQFYLYDYIVVNDDIDVALMKIKAVITAELSKQHRIKNIISDIVEDWHDNPLG